MTTNGSKGIVAISVLLLIVVLLFSIFDNVDANHLGVKVRLGKVTGTMSPGVELTGPLVRVYNYDMKIRKLQVDMLDEQSSATDIKGQMVFGSVSVNYRLIQNLSVVQELYKNVGVDKEIAYVLNIEPIIKEAYKQATVQYEAVDILSNRQKIKIQTIENIKVNFPSEYFEIIDVVVEDIDFSAEYKKSIEEKNIATQNKLKEKEQVEVVMYQQQQEIEVYKAEAEKLRLQKAEINELLINQQMIQNWDGQLPTTLIISPESQGLFLQLAQGNFDNQPTASASTSEDEE